MLLPEYGWPTAKLTSKPILPVKSSGCRRPALLSAGQAPGWRRPSLGRPDLRRARNLARILEVPHAPAQVHQAAGLIFRQDILAQAHELVLELRVRHRVVLAPHRVLDELVQR